MSLGRPLEARAGLHLEVLLVGPVGGGLGLQLVYGDLDLIQQQAQLGPICLDVQDLTVLMTDTHTHTHTCNQAWKHRRIYLSGCSIAQEFKIKSVRVSMYASI